MDRRTFLSSSAALAAGSAIVTSTSAAPAASIAEEPAAGAVSLKQGDLVLFQGDSITDAGRDRKSQDVPNNGRALGRGYPAILAGALLVRHRSLGLRVLNRGISGHKVPDLDKRWQADALDLKPAVLSILIGVNDIWHKLNGKYDGTPEVYRDGFAALLARTKEALPDVKLVVCEPFVLRCGAVDDTWFPEFDQRKAFAREVADGAGALWVPFQEAFDDAVAAGTEPAFWADDGVHPTVAGHALMAATWRRVVGL
jgi:lysophospholipase L1-like esterase